MTNFVFGRYIKRNSIIHRFDARFKFVCFILFLVLIFINKSFLIYFLILGLLLTTFLLAKLPLRIWWFLLKIFLIMALFLCIFNVITANVGAGFKVPANFDDEIVEFFKGFKLTYIALINTLYYALRVTMVVLVTLILVTTTRSVDLTNAVASILKPLRLIRFPTHIFAMIIVLTLRLVVTLVDEANSIMDAQASRGLDFYNGGLKTKIKALISLLIPLLISIFKRADEMALALESRGYNPYAKRSAYHQFIFRRQDLLLFSIFLMISGLLISYFYSFDWLTTVENNFILEKLIRSS